MRSLLTALLSDVCDYIKSNFIKTARDVKVFSKNTPQKSDDGSDLLFFGRLSVRKNALKLGSPPNRTSPALVPTQPPAQTSECTSESGRTISMQVLLTIGI